MPSSQKESISPNYVFATTPLISRESSRACMGVGTHGCMPVVVILTAYIYSHAHAASLALQ